MNSVEELVNYFNHTYGYHQAWPKTFEVSAELYGKCCRAIFKYLIENDDRIKTIAGEVHIIEIVTSLNGNIMFKNVELVIKDDSKS